MGAETGISWADHTFNPWEGCTRISPACDNCYAADRAHRFGNDHLWAGELRRTSPANWKQPLKWNAAAQAAGRPARVFCASLADVFDNQAPQEWREDLWQLIEATPHLIWMLLTKRPQNVVKMLRTALNFRAILPKNVELGVTAEDQHHADQRVFLAIQIGKAVKWPVFVSHEPALGPIDWTKIAMPATQPGQINALTGAVAWAPISDGPGGPSILVEFGFPPLAMVIGGGESGPKARPSHPAWFRSDRDQCAAAGVPFHFKQWGEFLPEGQLDRQGFGWAPGQDGRVHWWIDEPNEGDSLPDAACSIRIGTKQAGRHLDGIEHLAMPA